MHTIYEVIENKKYAGSIEPVSLKFFSNLPTAEEFVKIVSKDTHKTYDVSKYIDCYNSAMQEAEIEYPYPDLIPQIPFDISKKDDVEYRLSYAHNNSVRRFENKKIEKKIKEIKQIRTCYVIDKIKELTKTDSNTSLIIKGHIIDFILGNKKHQFIAVGFKFKLIKYYNATGVVHENTSYDHNAFKIVEHKCFDDVIEIKLSK